MSNELFPGLIEKSDFIFKISYEGNSFDGKINLHDLSEELVGFDYCLNSILSLAYKQNILDINPLEYEIIVEPFQKGSFKKIFRLTPKKIEKTLGKYKYSTNAVFTVALIFVGVGQIIVAANQNEINSMPQVLSQSSIDKIKLELLTDKEFLKAYSKVVSPLSDSTDSVRLVKPDNTEYSIDYSQKEKFNNFADEDFEFITEINETLYGRITRVDLTATKNAVGFKVNDSGITVPCSFLDSINADERKDLLDQWIEISGKTEKKGKERIHITIYTYKVINQPIQTELPLLEF